jgi:tRNA (guanine37-N1)-methyltransferase
MMKIDILTLFPEMFKGILESSILKKAKEHNAVTYNVVNFREFTENKHQKVDDYPYGGGAGMVLMAQPIFDAVESLTKEANKPRIVLLCPQGNQYNQAKAEELSKEDHLIFICGHYEGYDERIREHVVTDEVSIGDFVLTGGELASMVVIDSVVRLLPDVLGNGESVVMDSYSNGLLEHPHYTRPADFRGLKVPDVLLSGDHKKIEGWREKQSFFRTYERRKDLLHNRNLSDKEKEWIKEWGNSSDSSCD